MSYINYVTFVSLSNKQSAPFLSARDLNIYFMECVRHI